MEKFTDRESTILNSINEGVFTVDHQWRITSFNRAAERITGVPRQEALGNLCREVFRADACERDCVLRRTMADGRPLVNATANIITRDGGKVPIRISTAILRDAAGAVVGGVETFQDLSREEELRKKLAASYTCEDIVGRSTAMRRLFDILPQIAASPSTVLIEGASGTGKELFARAIHNLSPRRKKPFVAINCAALPDTLLESELFGHKAGAFTDAKRDKPGRFARADGGSIFLDEIGDVSPAMQARLLRVLQEREFEPLGATKPVPVDVRVVAATNRDLTALVAEGKFRQDLYYRIRVVQLKLPGLAERRPDIPILVEHFITKFNHLHGKEVPGIAERAMARLMEHDFPGNVRELENIVEQAFVLCGDGVIDIHHLPPELRGTERPPAAIAAAAGSIEENEWRLILETLRRNNGNRSLSAKELGVNPSTLYRKIKKYA